ncbi:MAG: glycosyltransferase, partial [Magnetospiraceae bacterium]
DPYAAHRAAPAMPPFSPGKIPVGLPIPERDRRILAYLPAKHPKLQALVTAMGATGARVDLVLPHPPATLQIPKTVHLHQSPLDLAEVLPAVRLLVYHGGLITAHAAIMAGTPQAVFPVNLEHLITGTSLEALGVARPLPEKTVERSYKDYISGLLEDAPLAQMALESAALMRPELIEAILESTVQACENLL